MGFDCSIPYGDNARYDFVVDVGGELLRIQCKSSSNPKKDDGTLDLNAFAFSCVSQTTNTKGTFRRKYTEDELDYFATVYNDVVYLVPVSECSDSKTLRLAPPKNECKTYNKAELYTVEYMLGHKINKTFLEEADAKANKEYKQKIYLCPTCGEQVSSPGVHCVKCAQEASRKVDRPSREELKKLIRSTPYVQIGRQFGVSDNAVRKWVKSYNLPHKVSDIKAYSDKDWELL